MSEPQSSYEFRLAYNSLLLVTSGLTASKMTFACQPFAYCACMVGGAVAVLGLLRVLFASKPEDLRMLRDINRGVLELLPLPLVNMELYGLSQGSFSPLVLGHCVSILPLLLDLNCSLFRQRKNCDLSETLRDVTMLANIISLGYLAYQECNMIYTRMSVVMFAVKYLPVILNMVNDGTGEDMIVCGSAYFFYQLGKVTGLTGEYK